MKLKVLRPFLHEGLHRPAGSIIEVEDHIGRPLIGSGQAEKAPDSAKVADAMEPGKAKDEKGK